MEMERTCLVCRRKAEKHELCRFVRAVDGEICFDERASLPHRGAWLCATRTCFAKAFQKKLLFKGEKTLPVTVEVMTNMVYGRIKKSSLSRLGILRKMGAIEVGRDAVKRLMLDEKASAVVFAKDFSERSHREIRERTSTEKPLLMLESSLSMDEIGQSIGRKQTGVVGLLKSRITDELLLLMKKLSSLEPG